MEHMATLADHLDIGADLVILVANHAIRLLVVYVLFFVGKVLQEREDVIYTLCLQLLLSQLPYARQVANEDWLSKNRVSPANAILHACLENG